MVHFPEFELTKLRKTDFFPAEAPDFSKIQSICIATKSRSLGDALALTTLPRKIKEKWPKVTITTLNRGFNPVVFKNNPFVSRVSILPKSVYGDDTNAGQGQLIQLKEQFFGLQTSQPPTPEIYLSKNEKNRSQNSKPILILHTQGTTRKNVASVETWVRLETELSRKFDVIRLGDHFLGRSRWDARKLFSLTANARAFVGVDSGPMHVARAFQIPSFILVNHLNPEDAFQKRKQAPYFALNNHQSAPLYEENAHFDTRGQTPDAIVEFVMNQIYGC